MDLFTSHGAIKSTLWPASRKNIFHRPISIQKCNLNGKKWVSEPKKGYSGDRSKKKERLRERVRGMWGEGLDDLIAIGTCQYPCERTVHSHHEFRELGCELPFLLLPTPAVLFLSLELSFYPSRSIEQTSEKRYQETKGSDDRGSQRYSWWERPRTRDRWIQDRNQDLEVAGFWCHWGRADWCNSIDITDKRIKTPSSMRLNQFIKKPIVKIKKSVLRNDVRIKFNLRRFDLYCHWAYTFNLLIQYILSKSEWVKIYWLSVKFD